MIETDNSIFSYDPVVRSVLVCLLRGGRLVIEENILGNTEVQFLKDIETMDREGLLTLKWLPRNTIEAYAQDLGPKDIIIVEQPKGLVTTAEIIVSSKLKAPASFDFHSIVQDRNRNRFQFQDRKALFLDRDGVIIKHVPYIKDPGLVQLEKGIIGLIQKAHNLNYLVIVVSNQSGVGRKLFGSQELLKINFKIKELLAAQGQWLDDVIDCNYFEGTTTYLGLNNAGLRKPSPGMLALASQRHGINLEQSVLVGDRPSDVLAGLRAGLNKTYLFKNTDFKEEWPKAQALQTEYGKERVQLIEDLYESEIGLS